MAESTDEEIVIACTAALVAALGAATILTLNNRKRKKTQSIWVKPYIRDREKLGMFNTLLPELASSETTRCVQYLLGYRHV
jgi:hypothetical protein